MAKRIDLDTLSDTDFNKLADEAYRLRMKHLDKLSIEMALEEFGSNIEDWDITLMDGLEEEDWTPNNGVDITWEYDKDAD